MRARQGPESAVAVAGNVVRLLAFSTCSVYFHAVIPSLAGWVKRCCGRIGRCVNLTCLIVLIPIAIVSLLIASDERNQNMEEVVAVYSLSFLHSWTYIWMVVATLRYLWSARKDRKRDTEEVERGEAPQLSYQELIAWENDASLLEDAPEDAAAQETEMVVQDDSSS